LSGLGFNEIEKRAGKEVLEKLLGHKQAHKTLPKGVWISTRKYEKG